MSSNKRRYWRVPPSGLVPRAAKILFNPEDKPIDCRLIDLSAGGACLELSRQYEFPHRFEFIHGRTRRSCRLAWKRNFRIGISFDAVKERSNTSGLSRTSSGSSRFSR
jgi:PilZ domain